MEKRRHRYAVEQVDGMENNSNILYIIFGVLGVVTSIIGIFYTTRHVRILREEENRQKAIDSKFEILWMRHDEAIASIVSIQKQLDILQGEHNVLACSKNKKK